MCLTGEVLENLAIRLMERADQRGPKEQGPPDRLPEDLFSDDEQHIKQHLDRCLLCRKRLLEQLCSEYRIREALNDPANESRFREAVGNAMFEDETVTDDGSVFETVLFLDPYPDTEDEGALAASSDSKILLPLRYCSSSGEMVLRQYPGQGRTRRRFLLIDRHPEKIRNAEIIIGGRSYLADESGEIEFPEDLYALSLGKPIIIRSKPV